MTPDFTLLLLLSRMRKNTRIAADKNHGKIFQIDSKLGIVIEIVFGSGSSEGSGNSGETFLLSGLVGALLKPKVALSRLFKILVPWPSLAKTEPDAKPIEAEPEPTTLKFTVTILPLEPVNPGLGTTPSKLAVPREFEKDGSLTHKETMEPDFDTEVACNLSVGNETTPERALTDWRALDTPILTVIVSPTA